MFRYFLVLYILYFLISVFKGNTTNQLDGQSNIPCDCQEHIPNNTTDQCALQQDNTNNQTSTSDVDFFDSSFTFSNELIEVGCCTRDAILTSVTCGRGSSCTGQCSAIEASLCPSGNCTGDPEDCRQSFELEEETALRRGDLRQPDPPGSSTGVFQLAGFATTPPAAITQPVVHREDSSAAG